MPLTANGQAPTAKRYPQPPTATRSPSALCPMGKPAKVHAFTPEGSRGQGSSVVSEIRIPEILDSMISFEGLMNHLLFCGEAIIDIQLNEQNQKSRGIVQEINQYIQEHYRESLTIKQLSEIFFLHPVYLGQLLSKRTVSISMSYCIIFELKKQHVCFAKIS
ncbi:hypothetical protein [Paenibacillus donghaensis]|uniref:hypothetical protein n=1 Tax=Paenibacillus donghaensis TaxID=414771 RepID=UPI001FEB5DCC|nr:hypothetical protein [Paenibacillus donghaensis]